MTTSPKTRSLLIAGAMAAVMAIPAFAYAFPQPVQEGDATYISGGIGDAERDALQAQAQDYNLQITNADKSGAFTTDTDLRIESQNGRQMISASGTGPLFYAKLPAGNYTIDATNGDQHRVRRITVSASKPEAIHLVWHDEGGQS